MHRTALVTLNMRELDRLKVIEAAVAECRLKPGQAADRLSLSVRQVERLVLRSRAAGVAGLVSGKRGRPSNYQLPAGKAQRALALIRERYADFGPTLACEKLRECHGIDLAVETVRTLMMASGLWIPRKQRPPKVYQQRNRHACLGELIQLMPMKEICRTLRRCERSIEDWLKLRRRIPWWVPEILRLKRLEHYHRCREHEGMGASVRKHIKTPLASVHPLKQDRVVFRPVAVIIPSLKAGFFCSTSSQTLQIVRVFAIRKRLDESRILHRRAFDAHSMPRTAYNVLTSCDNAEKNNNPSISLVASTLERCQYLHRKFSVLSTEKNGVILACNEKKADPFPRGSLLNLRSPRSLPTSRQTVESEGFPNCWREI